MPNQVLIIEVIQLEQTFSLKKMHGTHHLISFKNGTTCQNRTLKNTWIKDSTRLGAKLISTVKVSSTPLKLSTLLDNSWVLSPSWLMLMYSVHDHIQCDYCTSKSIFKSELLPIIPNSKTIITTSSLIVPIIIYDHLAVC